MSATAATRNVAYLVFLILLSLLVENGTFSSCDLQL